MMKEFDFQCARAHAGINLGDERRSEAAERWTEAD